MCMHQNFLIIQGQEYRYLIKSKEVNLGNKLREADEVAMAEMAVTGEVAERVKMEVLYA